MDIEAAHGIAPAANLVYVNLTAFGGKNASAASQFQQAFSTVAQDYPGAIWSVSLGQCEDIFSPTDVAAVNNAVKLAEPRRPSSPAATRAGSNAWASTSRTPRSLRPASRFPATFRR